MSDIYSLECCAKDHDGCWGTAMASDGPFSVYRIRCQCYCHGIPDEEWPEAPEPGARDVPSLFAEECQTEFEWEDPNAHRLAGLRGVPINMGDGMYSLTIVRKFFPDVERVRDARGRVTIAVTKADSNSSQVRNHKTCALAVACERKLKLDGVVISRAVAYLIKDNVATRYLVPESAVREVISFDRGGGFSPGVYELLRPHKGIRLGTTKKQRSKNRTVQTPRGKPRHITANIRTVLGAA